MEGKPLSAIADSLNGGESLLGSYSVRVETPNFSHLSHQTGNRVALYPPFERILLSTSIRGDVIPIMYR